MNPSTMVTEELLCQAYQEQAVCYAWAQQEAEEIVQAVRQGEEVTGRLQRLAAIAAEVAASDGRLGGWKQQWQQAGRRPGPPLQALLRQVAELIEQVLRCLGQAEQEATARAGALAPELDLLARTRQMQRAYTTTTDLPSRNW